MIKEYIMELVEHKDYVPMKIKEIRFLLQIPKKDQSKFNQVIDELIRDGELVMTKKGKIMKPEETIKVGIFEGHSKGFGFVNIEEKDSIEGMGDIFISEECTNGALHKDKVAIKIKEKSSGKRKEGQVLQILERGYTELIGTFSKNKDFGFVMPDQNKFSVDIYIPQGRDKGAVTGHKVRVKIKDYGNKNHKPEGIVKEIIGHVNDPGTDVLSIIRSYEIPVEFSRETMGQLRSIPDHVLEEEMEGRYDIRNWQTVTIDGEDAKDLDDAITLTKEDQYYILGVHIADVSHYIEEGSALDKDAIKRGTSVYLVDRVIPMLPPQLSNGICSLHAGVDRLALSCIMKIDSKGVVVSHNIKQSIIQVDERMSYTSVKKILVEKDQEEIEKYKTFIEMFKNMEVLSDILRSRREKRGAIDFDFPETKIILDNQGKPVEIKPYDRNVATKIIEDFMLAANETIAEDYFWNENPFVYRTHEKPDDEKMQKLSKFIQNFNYRLKSNEDIHPKELQKLLINVEGKPEEAFISRMILRSLKQARYTVQCQGHFGLSAKYYCHFTSPIRRYPDLQIHRIIKEDLNGKLGERRKEHYHSILPDIAAQSSQTERRAEETEREVEKLKKAVYMSERIGNIYEGIISSITGWGVYVELENTIEGLVHITTLADDYYIFDEENYQLIGERFHKSYKIGERVKVEVVKTDVMLRTIDFELRD